MFGPTSSVDGWGERLAQDGELSSAEHYLG